MSIVAADEKCKGLFTDQPCPGPEPPGALDDFPLGGQVARITLKDALAALPQYFAVTQNLLKYTKLLVGAFGLFLFFKGG